MHTVGYRGIIMIAVVQVLDKEKNNAILLCSNSLTSSINSDWGNHIRW